MAALPNLDVDDLVSEFGSYYIDEGQNIDRLKRLLRATSETEKLFPLRVTDETVYRTAQVIQGRVLQAFQQAYTPLGDLKFEPNVIPMYQMKIDLDIFPQQLVASWVGFLSGESIDPLEWPFMRWWLENEIIPQSNNDRELNEVFFGQFVAPTPGTASSISTSMDGILKKISDAATAGSSTLIALGAIPTGSTAAVDFCTYIENFVQSLPPLIRAFGGTICMSDTLNVLFRTGKGLKYNMFTMQETDLDTVRNFPKFTTKALLSHGDSQLVWYSPDFNKVRLLKNGDNINAFKVESHKRLLSAYSDWWFGLGYFLDKYIFHTDIGLL